VSTYVGEGTSSTTLGAETYIYTIDTNGDNSITQTDRSTAASGIVNPAAETSSPLDYALFRRVYGYDGSAYGGTLVPITAFLYTNATSSDLYPDGTSPDPLFVYYMTEDLNGDDSLDDTECVVLPCPPTLARAPQFYLWGDTDFDGLLSESEKSALRTLRVGSPSWSRNRLVTAGAYPTTTLSAGVAAGAVALRVPNAANFANGEFIQVGSGGSVERVVVSNTDMTVTPHQLTLSSGTVNAHASGESVAALERTFMRAIREVRVNFDAIVPVADYDTTTGASRRAGPATRVPGACSVRVFERRIDLLNMRGGA
jgi:hypothetical protein